MDDHLADVRRYDPTVQPDAVERIVKHLGVALKTKQSVHIKVVEPRQVTRLRQSWCVKKLGCEDQARADLAIEMAALAMSGDQTPRRVTFYYLVAKQLGQLDDL